MKSSSERYASPMDSFVAGLNSTVPLDQLHLNKIGWSARILKRISALALIVFITPMTMGDLFAQSASAPPPPLPPQQTTMSPDQGAPPPGVGQPEEPQDGAPQGEPLNQDQLGQLVAPIALYPDALVAQILAASTYPTEIVEADRWVQSQGNISPDQLGDAANSQNWDPGVKALVAFPSVLAQMDKNIQWTTDLGNAYFNQPADVMDAVQEMRNRAQAAGNLHDTPQQVVSQDNGNIVIAPANPQVVYVPVYNPWVVYGPPVAVFPGYYYGPPAGVYFGTGLAIGFGIGIGIGAWSHWGWGYHGWGFNWHNRVVVYNHNTYYTRSRTVIYHGYNRPGGPHGYPVGAHGSAYHGGAYNHGGSYYGGSYSHAGSYNHGGNYNHAGSYNHAGAYNHGGQGNYHGAPSHASEGHYNGGGHSGGGGYGGGGHGGGHGGGGHGH